MSNEPEAPPVKQSNGVNRLTRLQKFCLGGILGVAVLQASIIPPMANYMVYSSHAGFMRTLAKAKYSWITPSVRQDLLERAGKCDETLRDWKTYAPGFSFGPFFKVGQHRKAIDYALSGPE